ncbi:MAG: sugar ABC transporter permease [Dongiaceae bacterium]
MVPRDRLEDAAGFDAAVLGRWGLARQAAALLRPGLSWWFVAPALALFGLVIVWPMVLGVGFAFTDWNGLDRTWRLVGVANFRRIVGDRQVVSAIGTTLILAGSLVVAKMVIGLALALALNTAIKTRNILRLIVFMPVVLTPVITSYVWKYIFSTEGAINRIADTLGIGFLHQGWLGSPRLALLCVIIVTAWQSVGLAMVIFLAGLQAVPQELVEAATIDGASRWQRLRLVVLPLLAPAITVNVVLALVQGLKFFDQIYVLTAGGPGYATETLSTIIYKTSFYYGEFGYGSAIALVFAVMVAVLVFSATHALRRREIAHG